MTKKRLSSDLVKTEEPKRSLAAVLRGLRIKLVGPAIVAASLLKSSRTLGETPPAAVCKPQNHGREGRQDARGPTVGSVFAQNQSERGTLSINSSVESFDIRRTKQSDVIEVRFQNGKILTVEAEANSIQYSYIEIGRCEGAIRTPVDFTTVVDYMKDSGVSEVVSSSGGDDPKPGFRPRGIQGNDRVEFKKTDGSKLVVEFAPGSIKRIEISD